MVKIVLKNKKKQDDVKRHVYLCWKLIEYKIMYYHPEKVHPTWHSVLEVSDGYYDDCEVEYLRLCKKLGKPNTLVHKDYTGEEEVEGDGMFEVDFSRHSVQLVLAKISRPRGAKL